MATNKTVSRFVLLKNERPVKIYQTEWFKHSASFSMNKRDLYSFMCGVCTALGSEYSFDDYYPDDVVYNCTMLEV